MRYVLTLMVLFFCAHSHVCATCYFAGSAYAEEVDEGEGWEDEEREDHEEESDDGADT